MGDLCEREGSLVLKMKHCFFANHDESAGVQNTVVMWAVVPPGGSPGGSWLPVLPPGGRTCIILITEMLVTVYVLCLFFFTTCADEHSPVVCTKSSLDDRLIVTLYN